MRNVLALDIGGTSVKTGIISGDHRVELRGEYTLDRQSLVNTVCSTARQMAEHAEKQGITLDGVAVSATGQIDPATGTVVGSNGAIPGWEGVCLNQVLAEATEISRIHVENDANCAAFYEAAYGAAAGSRSCLLVTLGTGIGGGMVQNGRLVRGAYGLAGEFGHMSIEPGGRACTCGRRGCWEQYASTSALVRDVRRLMMRRGEPDCHMDGRSVFSREESGDREVHEVVERYFYYLAEGLTNLVHLINPDALVIGGGVSARGGVFLNRLQPLLEIGIMPKFYRGMRICTATVGNDAGLLGAAELFYQSMRE